jgi:hypothetical protein
VNDETRRRTDLFHPVLHRLADECEILRIFDRTARAVPPDCGNGAEGGLREMGEIGCIVGDWKVEVGARRHERNAGPDRIQRSHQIARSVRREVRWRWTLNVLWTAA